MNSQLTFGAKGSLYEIRYWRNGRWHHRSFISFKQALKHYHMLRRESHDCN